MFKDTVKSIFGLIVASGMWLVDNADKALSIALGITSLVLMCCSIRNKRIDTRNKEIENRILQKKERNVE